MDCGFRGACGGGWPEDAVKWIIKNGCATDEDYGVPYHQGPGQCKQIDQAKLYRPKTYGFCSQSNGNATYQEFKNSMAAYGVISICYDATGTPTGPPSTSKVWKGTGGRSVDHAIKAVAFDDSLSPKGAVLCWNQWYGDDHDFWWAEWNANMLGDSALWVDGGPGPTPAPTIDNITPTSGQAGGTLTVNGHSMVGGSVMLGTVGLLNAVATDSTITGTIPPGTGTVNVTVTTAAGSATLPNAFTYGVVPPIPPGPTPPLPQPGTATGSVTYQDGSKFTWVQSGTFTPAPLPRTALDMSKFDDKTQRALRAAASVLNDEEPTACPTCPKKIETEWWYKTDKLKLGPDGVYREVWEPKK